MAHPLSRTLVLFASVVLASCGNEQPPGPTAIPPNPPGRPLPPVSGNPTPANPTPGNPERSSNPGGPNPGSSLPVPTLGQTEFTTEEATGSPGSRGPSGPVGAPGLPGQAPVPAPVLPPAPPPVAQPAPAPSAPPAPVAMPPSGRVADVEEGDIYKVDQNRLFYLNTYRGFVIYDVSDSKKPQRLGRLPVFGYPVEMFITGNTVHALLRDALYLSQVGDKLEFERHNVSQLVTIDISDLKNPRLLNTTDIVGELREGVSRKIENTIYVVSYIPQSYYGGWRPNPSQQKEQATVYSFNVADRMNPTKAGEYKVFEGGSLSVRDSQGNSYQRNFEGVAISATANALMVVENWYVSSSSGVGPGRFGGGCGSYESNQLAHVTLIDISDPAGKIQPHASFDTGGNLTDQFKMTYVVDAASKTGTFYGIFARQVWDSSGCGGGSFTQNTLESWDVSVRGQPRRLDRLDFGKPNELVHASAYDSDRRVVYAITAQRVDPLYAISFADRADLRVTSLIDGLSGEMSVFRLVADKKFLLAVGQDSSVSCTGYQDTQGWRSTKIAVSLIDVQDLANIRLVQRQCVAVKNADWIDSGVTNNLDQAHKMLGMHADGSLNVITVPIQYSKRVDSANDVWWYQFQTAVGLMTWDLQKYDPSLSPAQQQVINNFGTFVHPHGEVRRSIVFTHQGSTPRRMMINLSDTHISIADIQDLNNPTLESEIELAPFYNQIYRFGDYLVEQVQSKPNSWGNPAQQVASFRVKKAGGDLDNAEPIASFEVGQVYRVLKHEQSLVLFRQRQFRDPNTGIINPPSTEAVVVDLRDPTAPRLAGKVALPTLALPYYRYWCGLAAYWGGFWFEEVASFVMTQRGFAFFVNEWRFEGGRENNLNKLIFLDVREPDAPAVTEQTLPETSEWGAFGLVADPVAPEGFYISNRKRSGEVQGADGVVYTQFKYYAQRWEPQGDRWSAVHDINTPGRLLRTWKSGAGDRMFLSQDTSYRVVMDGTNRVWFNDYRLSLLRQVDRAGKPAAELLGAHVLTDLYASALLIEGDRLYINGRPQKNYYYGYGGGGFPIPVAPPPPLPPGFGGGGGAAPLPSWESTSDRLIIFDLAAGRLALAFDQPTRMYNMQLMGAHQNMLFVNLGGRSSYYGDGSEGDGILVLDVSRPTAPSGVRFLRTLGYATHIEFFDDDVYVASGHFGLSHLNLRAAPEIPIQLM